MKAIGRKLFYAGVFALVAGAASQVWQFNVMPGDPGAPAVPAESTASAWTGTASPTPADSAKPGAARRSDHADRAARLCFAPDDIDDGRRSAACLAAAALLDDAELRGAALTLASSGVRSLGDDSSADGLLLLAAAEGDAAALGAYAMADGTGANTAPQPWIRHEALLLAAEAGDADARQALEMRRRAYRAESLGEPNKALALLEVRPLDLADDRETRRWLLGVYTSVQRKCVWDSPAWDTSTMARAAAQFAAPMQTEAHRRAAADLGHRAMDAASAFAGFSSDLTEGLGYERAAASLIQRLRGAQRDLNAAASYASEAGARDGLRLVSLADGCATASGMRLVRTLAALYQVRAGQTPARDKP